MGDATRWTAGPYRIALDGANTYRAEIVAKTPRGREVVIARLPTPNRSPEQCMANANLFLAAPALAEALERFTKAWDAGWHGFDFEPTPEEMVELHDAYDAACMALALTRGEAEDRETKEEPQP